MVEVGVFQGGYEARGWGGVVWGFFPFDLFRAAKREGGSA